MRQIKITDGNQTVTLLKDLIFTIKQEVVGTTATMASGRVVMDVVGTKTILDVPVGYLSREDISILRSMINTSRFLTISYPDVDGDKTAVFIVDPIELKTFKYGDDGVSVWYGFTLHATGAEVD